MTGMFGVVSFWEVDCPQCGLLQRSDRRLIGVETD